MCFGDLFFSRTRRVPSSEHVSTRCSSVVFRLSLCSSSVFYLFFICFLSIFLSVFCLSHPQRAVLGAGQHAVLVGRVPLPARQPHDVALSFVERARFVLSAAFFVRGVPLSARQPHDVALVSSVLFMLFSVS